MDYTQFIAHQNVESCRVEPVGSHAAADRQCKCRILAHRQCRNFDKEIIEIPTLTPCFDRVPRTLNLIPNLHRKFLFTQVAYLDLTAFRHSDLFAHESFLCRLNCVSRNIVLTKCVHPIIHIDASVCDAYCISM